MLKPFHSIAVDMKWLGVHYCDLFDESGEVKVAVESLQPWVASDARVFSSIHSSIESLNTVRGFFHELSILIFQSCHTYICTYTVIQYHLYTACSNQYSTNHCDPSHVPVSLFS